MDLQTIIFSIGGMFLYFVPTMFAFVREHPQKAAIFALNLLLGWTILGWAGAFVWACLSTKPMPVEIPRTDPSRCSSCARLLIPNLPRCKYCGAPIHIPRI